jgi:hypothetical protein
MHCVRKRRRCVCLLLQELLGEIMNAELEERIIEMVEGELRNMVIKYQSHQDPSAYRDIGWAYINIPLAWEHMKHGYHPDLVRMPLIKIQNGLILSDMHNCDLGKKEKRELLNKRYNLSRELSKLAENFEVYCKYYDRIHAEHPCDIIGIASDLRPVYKS